MPFDRPPRNWWPGRYSDGLTAATRAAVVKLDLDGVAIAVEGAPPLIWRYADLSAAFPVAQATQDVLLTLGSNCDVTLFVADAEFVRALANRAPQLTAGAERWRTARPWMALTAAILVLVGIGWLLGLSPSHAVAMHLPDAVRTQLGANTIKSMTGKRRMCGDPDGQAALERLVARLSRTSGSVAKFKITVVDWNLLNAFAVPGEQIVVTRELIEKAKSPDEVAGVVAHEMGHGIERHPETGIVRAIGLNAAIELIMGGNSGTLGNVGLVLAQLSYSRDAEREADAHALRLLKAAGVSPHGLAGFFARVADIEKERARNGAPAARRMDILATHPNIVERAAIVAKQPDYPAMPALDDKDWRALQSICRAGTAE